MRTIGTHRGLRRAAGLAPLALALVMGVAACGGEDPASGTDAEATDEMTDEEMTDEATHGADDEMTGDEMTDEEMTDDEMTDSSSEQAAAIYDFSGTTLEGASFEGASLAGTPTVMWFWAPWCPTCAAEAPEVSALASQYEGQVNVVGVGGLDSAAAMPGFVEQRGVGNFPHLVDEAGEVWRHFGVTAQSTFVIIDEAGGVVAEGRLTPAEVGETLTDLAA